MHGWGLRGGGRRRAGGGLRGLGEAGADWEETVWGEERGEMGNEGAGQAAPGVAEFPLWVWGLGRVLGLSPGWECDAA